MLRRYASERIHRGQLGEVKVGFFGSAPFVEGFQKLIFDFRIEHADVDLILRGDADVSADRCHS